MRMLKSLVLGLLVAATSASAQVRSTYFNYQDLYAYLPGVWMTNNPDRPQFTIQYSGNQLWGSVSVEQVNSWGDVIRTYDTTAEPIYYIGQNLIEFSGEQYFIQLVPSAYDRDYELELQYVGRSSNGYRYGYDNGVHFTSATKDLFAYINTSRACPVGHYYSYDYARCIRIAAYQTIPSCVIQPSYLRMARPRYQFEYREFSTPRFSNSSRYRAGSAYNPDPRRGRTYTPRPVPARPPVIVEPAPRRDDRRDDRGRRSGRGGSTTPPVIVTPPSTGRGDDRGGNRGGRVETPSTPGNPSRGNPPSSAPSNRGGSRAGRSPRG